MNTLVNGLIYLGLTTPLTRAMFGAALGFVAQHILSPGISYYKDPGSGETIPKTFVLLADSNDKNTTYLPWYFIPVLGGLLLGLFL